MSSTAGYSSVGGLTAFVSSRWRRSLTFLSGTRRTSSTSAKERFCATFDSRPLTRPLQSAIMILLVGRPPEAPYISMLGIHSTPTRERVTINKSDGNPTSIFFSPFKNVTSRRKHPVNWLGVFFMPKKPPLGHLPGIAGRGAGGIIAFILHRYFGKVKKI